MTKKCLWLAIGVVALCAGCAVQTQPQGKPSAEQPTSSEAVPTKQVAAEARAPKEQWFRGGTLHNSTIGQWRRATYENKVATASDWLAATKWDGHLNSPSDFDRLKVKSQRLANGVDESILGLEGSDSLQINEIAASLITLSNDLGP